MSDTAMEKIANQELIDGFLSHPDSDMYKESREGGEEYLRMRLYENGFFRKILPIKSIGPDDLTDQVDTDVPCKVVEKEPYAPAAYSVPFSKMPIGAYIKGPKFRVMFARIMSKRFRIDIDKLATYRMDIKKVMEEILLKKIQREEDRKFLLLGNFIVTRGQTAFDAVYNPAYQNAASKNTDTGVCQNITLGPMDRDSLSEMTKGLPSSNRSLDPALGLVNNITVRDVVKLSRDEIGGDLAEEMFKNGFSEQKIMGLDWVVTIKKDLVHTNTIYQFATPEYTGKNYALRDLTIETKSESFWIEFWAWETLGGAIANDASLCVSHFTGTAVDWVTGAPLP